MYAVIFKARTKVLSDAYFEIASRMRELALNSYGCSEFISVTEGNQEISISYWNSMDDISNWKKNSEHLVAQELGKNSWYESYHVEIVEILREYKKS